MQTARQKVVAVLSFFFVFVFVLVEEVRGSAPSDWHHLFSNSAMLDRALEQSKEMIMNPSFEDAPEYYDSGASPLSMWSRSPHWIPHSDFEISTMKARTGRRSLKLSPFGKSGVVQHVSNSVPCHMLTLLFFASHEGLAADALTKSAKFLLLAESKNDTQIYHSEWISIKSSNSEFAPNMAVFLFDSSVTFHFISLYFLLEGKKDFNHAHNVYIDDVSLRLSYVEKYYVRQWIRNEIATSQLFTAQPLEIIEPISKRNYEILPNFAIPTGKISLDGKDAGGLNTSLCVPLTLDRLDRLVVIANSWSNLISAVLYVAIGFRSRSSIINSIAKGIHELRLQHPMIAEMSYFHLVLCTSYEEEECLTKFPINILRNVAVENAPSDWVFVVDVDIVLPNSLSYDSILHHINLLQFKKSVALVIPSFESVHAPFIPKTKEKVIEFLEKGLLSPYKFTTDVLSQFATNYHKWMCRAGEERKAKGFYKIEYSNFYDPFVVVNKKTFLMPPFPENIHGITMSKTLFNYLLGCRGFEFYVLPDVYLLHIKHESSPAEKHFHTDPILPFISFHQYLTYHYDLEKFCKLT